MKERVLVTGTSGFVGRNIALALASAGYSVVAASRSMVAAGPSPNVTAVRLPDLEDFAADWAGLLNGMDAVVHAAGLAHGSVDDPRHDAINHLAVARLVKAVQAHDVQRFIFISSLAAQVGSSSVKVLTEYDEPAPVNAYGRAKLAAEMAIRDSSVRYTILRPPAMYGDDARGNFALLERLAGLPIPLPFGSLDAPRSFLSVDNLSRAVLSVLQNPAAEKQTYIAADPWPLSVRTIVTRMRQARGRRPNLVPVPPASLKYLLTAIGRKHIWERIGEPLVVSSERLLSIGWRPRPWPDEAGPGR